MKDFRVIATAGLAMVVITPASAFAQEGATSTQAATEIVGEVGAPELAPVATSAFTLDTVDPSRPFGDLDVDPTAPRYPIDAGLTPAQRDELKGRCAVILANELRYETSIVIFCTSYVSITN